MKLVQKILSHGLLIVFVVAAFLLYTKREQLFPQWFGAAHTASERATESTIAQAGSQDAAGSDERRISRPLPEKTLIKKDVSPPPTPPAPEEQAPAQGAPAGDTSVPAPAEGASPAAETDAAGSGSTQQPEASEVHEQPASTPAAPEDTATTNEAPDKAAAKTAENGPATVTASAAGPAAASAAAGSQAGSPDAKLEAMLEQARALYWRRDLRAAASAYEATAKAYPDNADVWGEIGNFYFSLRQPERAGAAYARAVRLLDEQNEPLRARKLLAVLYRLDPAKARALENRLREETGG